MRRLALGLSVLALLLAAAPPAGARPAPVDRTRLLGVADYESVLGDLHDPIRIVMRSPLFAPRGCEDQGKVVRGHSRILSSLSPDIRPRSLEQAEQNVVRLRSEKEARAVVRRYRHFSERCVGDVRTDDGEGTRITLKNRAWTPPALGDQSAGMLIGWFSHGSADSWRRVLAIRVGRTVTVLDIDVDAVRPRASQVVALGELAVARLIAP